MLLTLCCQCKWNVQVSPHLLSFFSLLTPLPNASAQERTPSGIDKADKCGAFTCAGTSPAFFFPSFTTPPGLKTRPVHMNTRPQTGMQMQQDMGDQAVGDDEP